MGRKAGLSVLCAAIALLVLAVIAVVAYVVVPRDPTVELIGATANINFDLSNSAVVSGSMDMQVVYNFTNNNYIPLEQKSVNLRVVHRGLEVGVLNSVTSISYNAIEETVVTLNFAPLRNTTGEVVLAMLVEQETNSQVQLELELTVATDLNGATFTHEDSISVLV